MKAVRVNLFGGSSTKQRPDSEPRSLGDHGSVFRFLGSQLEGKILRGPMCIPNMWSIRKTKIHSSVLIHSSKTAFEKFIFADRLMFSITKIRISFP